MKKNSSLEWQENQKYTKINRWDLSHHEFQKEILSILRKNKEGLTFFQLRERLGYKPGNDRVHSRTLSKLLRILLNKGKVNRRKANSTTIYYVNTNKVIQP